MQPPQNNENAHTLEVLMCTRNYKLIIKLCYFTLWIHSFGQCDIYLFLCCFLVCFKLLGETYSTDRTGG